MALLKESNGLFQQWIELTVKQIFEKEFVRYGARVSVVYVVWKIAFLLLHGSWVYAHFWIYVVNNLGAMYANATSFILNCLHENTYTRGITIIYTCSGRSIRVEEHCLAIPVAVLFTGAILCFKNSKSSKYSFIAAGIAGILLINVFRLVCLTLLFEYCSANFYSINHTYVYLFLTYGLVLSMINKWMQLNN